MNARPADRQLLIAVAGLATKIDDELWLTLAQAMIESPSPLDSALIAGNAFYRQYPNYRSKFADVTFTILHDDFSDLFDEYELGLLSAMIPESDRVVDQNLLLKRVRYSSTEAHLAKVILMNKQLLADPDYRPYLLRLSWELAQDPDVMGYAQFLAPNLRKTLKRDLAKDDIDLMVERLARDRMNSRDAHIQIATVATITNQINDHARTLNDNVEHQAFRHPQQSVSLQVVERDWFTSATERYFALTPRVRIRFDVGQGGRHARELGSRAHAPHQNAHAGC